MKKRGQKLEIFFSRSPMLGQTKGQILVENVVFIILNLIFLTILILFIYSKSGSEALLEEKYAKQIALLIDSAKPGMEIHLNMQDAIEQTKKEWGENHVSEIVSIQGNIVTVKLREKGGYSYSFFNDVELENVYPIDINTNDEKKYDSYRFKIKPEQNQENE